MQAAFLGFRVFPPPAAGTDILAGRKGTDQTAPLIRRYGTQLRPRGRRAARPEKPKAAAARAAG